MTLRGALVAQEPFNRSGWLKAAPSSFKVPALTRALLAVSLAHAWA